MGKAPTLEPGLVRAKELEMSFRIRPLPLLRVRSSEMTTTKELYKLLDEHRPKVLCYNLQKVRLMPYWRIRIWKSADLDRKGVVAPFIQDELYPEHSEESDTVADFKRVCELAIKDL